MKDYFHENWHDSGRWSSPGIYGVEGVLSLRLAVPLRAHGLHEGCYSIPGQLPQGVARPGPRLLIAVVGAVPQLKAHRIHAGGAEFPQVPDEFLDGLNRVLMG